MADYYTQFACRLNVGSEENVLRALKMHRTLTHENEPDLPLSDCFAVEASPPSDEDDDKSTVWIHDGDGCGDTEAVIQFVKLCAAEFHLTGKWGFAYAETCSKHRLDGFGGGAHAVDLATGKTVGWINTNDWLATVVDPAPASDQPLVSTEA